MCDVINLRRERRARRGAYRPPSCRRARPTSRRHEPTGGFVSIGEIAAEMVRRLR